MDDLSAGNFPPPRVFFLFFLLFLFLVLDEEGRRM